MAINYLRSGALFALFAVALGAFGAHGLKSIVEPDKVSIFETGVRYQFYHAFALLIVGLIMLHAPNAKLRMAGKLFSVGIFCFSGSLYLLAIREVLGLGGFTAILGPITPIGGVILIAGWLYLFLGLGADD